MLRVRWLGRVGFDEAYVLQQALHRGTEDDYFLLLEHDHVLTLGAHGDESHILVDPGEFGASVVRTDRGGDVTYHGPGQIVGYPIVSLPDGPRAVAAHVHSIEQLVIDTVGSFGVRARRLAGYPGVWVEGSGAGAASRKICAIGVRVSRGRSMHGLALNVDPDLAWFDRIVPCGIADKKVTSLRQEGVDAPFSDVVDRLAAGAKDVWGGCRATNVATAMAADDQRTLVASNAARSGTAERPLRIRLRQVGIDPDGGVALRQPKPAWLRVPVRTDDQFRSLRSTMRGLDLVTVCEEAGCPNIFECWADGTATFMINGDRCTRACGFCLVDTSKPLALDPAEPSHVADAVEKMGLEHAVVTAVARDDLPDGGAAAFAATTRAIRERCPGTTVELLIPDCKGKPEALDAIFDAKPDVLNHNLETVARLQRAVRPSAGYARSLTVLARAKRANLVTKSGLILGMGERADEVVGALADLRAVGVDIVTMGQYLRPTSRHLPVERWLRPEEFAELGARARAMGFAHVESSPLTRSSYHAKSGAQTAMAGTRHQAGVDHALVGSPR